MRFRTPNGASYRAPLAVALAALLTLPGCVNIDPETNEPLPREGQRYTFARVQELAEDLRQGMSRLEVTLLLGSAAEESEDGRTWVYLPERTAILIPARALKLEFVRGRLNTWGYHAIVLGQRL